MKSEKEIENEKVDDIIENMSEEELNDKLIYNPPKELPEINRFNDPELWASSIEVLS